MRPEDVEEFAHRLRACGEQLDIDWGAAKSAIGRLEVGIGDGRLAAAFRSSYGPPSEQARTNADPFPSRLTALGDATLVSADTYVGMDGDNSESFPRLGG